MKKYRKLTKFSVSLNLSPVSCRLKLLPKFSNCIYDILIFVTSFTMYLVLQTHSTPQLTALAITGTLEGTNLNKIHDELGWESLTDRRWSRRLFHFYKIQNNLTPYLATPVPPITHLFGGRSVVIKEISPKFIAIVSILIVLDVGIKLVRSYVILSTLSLLRRVFWR